MWVVSFTPRGKSLRYSLHKTSGGPQKQSGRPLPGFELRPLVCQVRSQSLYRLSYPGFIPRFLVLLYLSSGMPVTVAERSKACTVFARLEAGIWVRVPHKAWMFGMCVCLFCVCVVPCRGRGLATSWSLVQGVLPSIKWSWNWKIRGQGPRGL
jgi:hypothetical protein